MIHFYNIILFFSVTLLISPTSAVCIHEDPCSCQINEDTKLDISTIFNDNLNYLNDTVGVITYTFIGCRDKPYTYPPSNGNVTTSAGVLFRAVYGTTNSTNNSTINSTIMITNYTVLGNASQIQFTTQDNIYSIVFANNLSQTIQPTITLLCDPFNQPFLKVIDEENQKLLLSSPKVCLITEHHDGMSGGAVFLLILFISALIYFVGGALLLYFIRGARGSEMIPNIDFWRNLPGLAKDGAIFLLSGCRPNLVTTAETYDRI